MQSLGSIKYRPVQISWGQSYSRSEVLEPNHLDGNRMSVHLNIVDEYLVVHEPPMVSPIMVQGRRCPTGGIITKEPHI